MAQLLVADPESAPAVAASGEGSAPDELLTFGEAMAFLKVSRSTLHRMRCNGDIRGHRLGRTWRFWRSELTAALK